MCTSGKVIQRKGVLERTTCCGWRLTFAQQIDVAVCQQQVEGLKVPLHVSRAHSRHLEHNEAFQTNNQYSTSNPQRKKCSVNRPYGHTVSRATEKSNSLPKSYMSIRIQHMAMTVCFKLCFSKIVKNAISSELWIQNYI